MSVIDILGREEVLNLYLLLLRQGPKSIDELEYILKIPRETIEGYLAKLTKHELVIKMDNKYYPLVGIHKFFEEVTPLATDFLAKIEESKSLIDRAESLLMNSKKKLLKELSKTLESQISDMTKKIQKAFSEMMDNLKSLSLNVQEIVDIIKNYDEKVSSDISSFVSDIEASILQLNNTLSQVQTEILNLISKKIRDVINELDSLLSKSISQLESNLQVHKNNISTLISDLLTLIETNYGTLEDKIAKFRDDTLSVLQDQKDKMEQLGIIIDDALKAHTSEFSEKIHLLNKELSGILSELSSDIKQSIERFASTARRKISGLESTVRSVLMSVIDTAMQQFNVEATNLYKDFSQKLESMKNELISAKDEVVNMMIENISGMKNRVENTFKKVKMDLTNCSQEIITMISEKADEINNLISNFIEFSIETLLEITKNYEDLIRHELESLYGEILNERRDLIEYFNRNFAVLNEKLQELGKGVKEYNNTLAKKTVEKIRGHYEEISTQVDEIIDDYNEKIEKEMQAFSTRILSDFGKNIARSIIGIKRDRDSTVKALRGIYNDVSGLQESVKKVLSGEVTQDKKFLEEIHDKLKKLSGRLKKLMLTVDNLSIRREDELSKIKHAADLLISDATKSFTEDLLTNFLNSLKESVKKYIKARVEDLENDFKAGLERLHEKVSREISWINASFNTMLGELKNRIERGDQAIFGVFDSISRRSIDIGRNTISEREKESEAIQTRIRRELTGLIQKLNQLLTEKFNEMIEDIDVVTSDISNMFGDVNSSIRKLSDETLNASISVIDRIDIDIHNALDTYVKTINDSLEKFKVTSTKKVQSIIEDINTVLTKYQTKFNEKTIGTMDQLRGKINSMVEELATLIDDTFAKISTNVHSNINRYLGDFDGIKNIIEKDILSINEVIKTQFNGHKENIISLQKESTGVFDKLIMDMRNNYKGIVEFFSKESRWTDEQFKNNIINTINKMYEDIKMTYEIGKEKIQKITEETKTWHQKLISNVTALNKTCKKTSGALSKEINGITKEMMQAKERYDKTLEELFDETIQKIRSEILDKSMEMSNELLSLSQHLMERSEPLIEISRKLSDILINNLRKATITFGKNSFEAYLNSVASTTEVFLTIVMPELISNIDQIIKLVKPDTHLEIIAPARVLKELSKGDVKRLITRTIKYPVNYFIVIRDDREAILSIRKNGEYINYVFFDPHIINSLKIIIAHVSS